MSNAKKLINYLMVFKKTPLSGINNGTPGTGGIKAVEKGDGIRHVTELTFNNAVVPLTDNPGVVAYLGKLIYSFPLGAIKIEHVVSTLTAQKTSSGLINTWAGVFSVGTVAANNNNTLTATEANLLPSTAIPAATAGTGTEKGQMTQAVYLDGTQAQAQAFLNLLVNGTDESVSVTPCNLIFNGTITVTWLNGGKY